MLNWGIIGPGLIARVFCNGMRFSKTGRVAAIASRSRQRAEEVAEIFSIPKRYEGYEPLLANDEIDAVYVSTIYPAHAEWAIKTAEAGKCTSSNGSGHNRSFSKRHFFTYDTGKSADSPALNF